MATNTNYDVTIRSTGAALSVYVNGHSLVATTDGAHVAGGIAFYVHANPGAQFSSVLVVDAADHLGNWTIRDEATSTAPSVWKLANGALVQTSSIGDSALPSARVRSRSWESASWADYRIA